ncbi:MAG: phosphotransferase [Planctomycetota bacterium]|nr:phosphotransferase [Planctomycetota bacterium]
MTLADLAAAGQLLGRVAMDAEAQGLEMGRIVAVGGHSVLVAGERENSVIKIPSVLAGRGNVSDPRRRGQGPNRVRQVSPTGPIVLQGVRTQEQAEELLVAACDRHETALSVRLPRLLGRRDLAGVPVAIFEYLRGRSLGDAAPLPPAESGLLIRDVASALGELHDVFGAHGDIKPDHIFLQGPDRMVKFIDPLSHPHWLGSVGYMLGWHRSAGPDDEEARGLRDLGALVAIIAEMHGGDVGWDGGLVYLLANRGNGRFGRGLDFDRVRDDLRKGLSEVPSRLQSWAMEMGERYLDHIEGGGIPDKGYCRGKLKELAN